MPYHVSPNGSAGGCFPAMPSSGGIKPLTCTIFDLHKEQYTAVIMGCFNEKLGEITFQIRLSEFGKLITKCKKYCTDRKGIVFALENSYGYGRALAAWLIERNYIVRTVRNIV